MTFWLERFPQLLDLSVTLEKHHPWPPSFRQRPQRSLTMQFEENLGLSFAIRVERGVKADRGESAGCQAGRLSEKGYLPPAGVGLF